MKTWMRVLVLTATLAAALASSATAMAKHPGKRGGSALDVSAFEGSYVLTHGVYGQCDTEMSVYKEDTDPNHIRVLAGSTLFNDVGAGPTLWEDQFERTVTVTRIIGSSLIEDESSYDKLQQLHIKRHYSMTLHGRSMHFVSTDSQYASLPTVCNYKKVADQGPR